MYCGARRSAYALPSSALSCVQKKTNLEQLIQSPGWLWGDSNNTSSSAQLRKLWKHSIRVWLKTGQYHMQQMGRSATTTPMQCWMNSQSWVSNQSITVDLGSDRCSIFVNRHLTVLIAIVVVIIIIIIIDLDWRLLTVWCKAQHVICSNAHDITVNHCMTSVRAALMLWLSTAVHPFFETIGVEDLYQTINACKRQDVCIKQ